MLNHPTLDQLKTLKLDGMAEAFTELQTQDSAATLGHAEWLGLLIDRETASRDTKRFESRIRTAKLRHGGAVPEDVDSTAVFASLPLAIPATWLTARWVRRLLNQAER